MTRIKELREKNKLINNNNDEYDEEEQARLFRKAVEEFRNGKTEAKTEKESKGESGTDPVENSDLLPVNKERRCCWNCLKVILSTDSIEHYFQEKIMKYKVVNIYLFILDILF
jgi:hypothetical protein